MDSPGPRLFSIYYLFLQNVTALLVTLTSRVTAADHGYDQTFSNVVLGSSGES